MKEERKTKRMRCEKLKTLKLYQRRKSENDINDLNNNENKEINNEKNNKPRKLYKNLSSLNLFNKMLESIPKTKVFSPLIQKEEQKELKYEVEKGMAKHPLCLYSKNKYHFGSTKNVNKTIKQNNPNASTKMTEQNYKLYSNIKKIYAINNYKNNLRNKPLRIIKLRKNNEINYNKINLYKKYNNGTGLDKHIIPNKSCPDFRTDIDYYSYINNSTKEDMQKLNSTKNILNNKYSNIQNDKNTNILFHPTLNIKGSEIIRDLSHIRKNQKNIKIIKKNKSKENNKIDDFYKVMSKYHFIRNNYLIELDEKQNKQMENKIKNFNKNEYNVLIRENEKLFSHFSSIIPVNKFSEKFRDPLNNSFDRELEQSRKIKDQHIIKKDILPGIKLLKDMDVEIQKRKIIKKEIKGKALIYKIKRIIIRNIEYIKRLNVSLEEIFFKYKRSPMAFSYSKTEDLILAIRNKNYELCCDILDNYKFLVLDFDYFYFTPLHWAVKINFYQIIPKLISYGAGVNEQNFMGETPLHISANKNYYESTALLLLYLASPFIKDKNNKKPVDRTKDFQLIFIFKKITELHLKYSVYKQKNFFENVQKEFIDFIGVEFSNQLNPEALSLITNLK